MKFPQPNSKQSRRLMAAGAVLLLVSVVLLALIVSGKTRRSTSVPVPEPETPATTTSALVPRRLDGVLVAPELAALRVRAVMVENHPDARPLSGLSKASVVIEAPVEGGITRFLALYDASTTAEEIGPVRSARPYYVDWAYGWRAAYLHVGGSPEALEKIRGLGAGMLNVDEMGSGNAFWRARDRDMPHNTYTDDVLMNRAVEQRGGASTTPPVVWHFADAATTTERGDTAQVRIPYGGTYNVLWKYDRERNAYARWQAGRVQKDKDGSSVESENVAVIKTDAQVLDEVGRLRVRTTGSGDAVAYRDGKKFLLRWRRTASEPIRFEGNDGAEFLFGRGRTWIEVTTDDRLFAGLER